MKHRHLRYLLRGAILPMVENRHVICSTQRQPQLYPPTLEAASYSQRAQPDLFAEVEALECKSVSTAEIRLLLLNELTHLRRFTRKCQRAGTGHRRRQGHLVQRIRLFLDRLPSPRSVERKRHRQGMRIYRRERESWRDYIDERRWCDEFKHRIENETPILEIPDFYQHPREPTRAEDAPLHPSLAQAA